jgi:hypothetical protein
MSETVFKPRRGLDGKHLSKPLFATTMLWWCIAKYGPEPFLGEDPWDPRTVQLELTQDAGVVPDDNLARLFAALEILRTTNFESALPDFIRLCNILSGEETEGPFDPADVDEIAWAAFETTVLLGAPAVDIHPEIRSYVKAMLVDEGYATVPDLLKSISAPLDDNSAAYSDDPAFFEVVQTGKQDKLEQLNAAMKRRVQAFKEQIEIVIPEEFRGADWLETAIKDTQKER